jgi:hypothetical protein
VPNKCDVDINAMIAAMLEMSLLLRRYDNTSWAERIDDCRFHIEKSDFYGVEKFRGFLGGMGSLNDVVLQRGGSLPQADNERFDTLRVAVADCVEHLRRKRQLVRKVP